MAPDAGVTPGTSCHATTSVSRCPGSAAIVSEACWTSLVSTTAKSAVAGADAAAIIARASVDMRAIIDALAKQASCPDGGGEFSPRGERACMPDPTSCRVEQLAALTAHRAHAFDRLDSYG